MKTSLTLAVCVSGLLALASGHVAAQPPSQRPPAGNGPPVVAVVDFERLMTNYVRAKHIREMIRKDKENAETTIRKETAEIEKEKEKLKDYKPGRPEFKQLEEQLAQRVSELNVRFKIQQRDFQEREQKAFYGLYVEISEEVKHYADIKGISLVLPYSSEPVDPNVPESIQKALSRVFVYQNGPDITEPILQELNRRAVATATKGGSQAPAKR